MAGPSGRWLPMPSLQSGQVENLQFMLGRLRQMFGQPKRREPEERVRERRKIFEDHLPDVIYAIGDTHGCLDLLKRLEAVIAKDAATEAGEKVLMTLGDYVDRGPQSSGVLDHLMSSAGRGWSTTIHLAGNHEDVMLDFLENPSQDHQWLRFGGRETLLSYGIRHLPENRMQMMEVLRASIPDSHVLFLADLPSMASFPDLCFVHAGVDTSVELKDQRDSVLLWKRPSADTPAAPYLVVHGHTPVEKVEIGDGRVNIDTGAYATGVLSAVKIRKSGEIYVVSCGMP